MKKIIKWYILLYNAKSWNKAQGDYVGFRFDRVKHGFAGDFISILVFVLIGNWNNWGENIHFDSDVLWMFYYVLLPLLAALVVGIGKELYDKKTTGLFDWGDVWATVLPFAWIYLWFKEVLFLVFRRQMNEIYDEILKGR